MIFDLARSISVLERTPTVLRAWLTSLDSAWTHTKDREDTWSPFDVLGHLIHGERTDWIPRAKIILSDSPPADRIFEPFDRFAQFRDSEGKTLGRLLDEFEQLRVANLRVLKGLGITESDLDRTGVHPALGQVTLSQLLATWTAHDLNHIGQIAEVMARQYRDELGPWLAYLGIMHDGPVADG